MMDTINSQRISDLLEKDLKNKISIEALEKATSTNTLLKEAASEKEEGFVLVAGEQTQGRGRLGRSFFSPGDTGLYMSLLLKPSITPEQSVLITTAAAVSVCKALEKVGVENTAIKWVNDVFLNDKKVCGILTEASFNPQKGALDYVVLGVGINVYEPDGGFPDELQSIAGAILGSQKENLRNTIAAEFLNSFMVYYNALDKREYSAEYARKCFVIGRDINIISNGVNTPARAVGLDENFGLLAELPDGSRVTLNSGEISVRVKT